MRVGGGPTPGSNQFRPQENGKPESTLYLERRMTEVIGHVEGLLRRMERGTPGARARWN